MVINNDQTYLVSGNRLIESGTIFGEIWGKITNDAQISRFGKFRIFGEVEGFTFFDARKFIHSNFYKLAYTHLLIFDMRHIVA
jgi:hypothetical protein